MLMLRDKTGGCHWEFVVPHTGVKITAGSWEQLLYHIRKHLNANGFENATIEEAIIEQYNAELRAKLNPECCYDKGQLEVKDRKLTYMDVVRFTKTMIKNIAGGSKRVSQEEADRRAAICASCNLNVVTDNCITCSNSGAAAAVVGALVGDRKTSSHQALNSCLHCGCFLKAMVWFPVEDLKHSPPSQFQPELPDHCWKK